MNVSRYFFNNRLVYYIPENTFDWDTHWANLISPSLYRSESQGLGMLSFLSKFLPRNGRILEAGCGTGHVVHELCLQGFKCEGVDNARKTIQKINELVPFLPVRRLHLLLGEADESEILKKKSDNWSAKFEENLKKQ